MLRTLDQLIGRSASDELIGQADAQPAVWRPDDSSVRLLAVAGPRDAGRIDLLRHEGRGVPPSHTIAMHVGKSRAFLMAMMQPIEGRFATAYRTRHSTFSSLEAANRLISSTLATGREVEPGVFYKEFSSPTGTAAVRREAIPFVRPQGRVHFETAYGVLVVTKPDANMPGGFRVQTAYPTTPFSGRPRGW